MGQQQSKDKLLYQQVNNGNIESVKALFHDGAGLEWIDKEGKTPLIVACMNSELLPVAKTLIELGANVNAYRPGCQAGTPLHHAAKKGLEHTINLLLSHGANALVVNDDCQTPLDVARAKGYSNIVRAIESHICFFSGWLRELYGPEFLEAFAPQWVWRKIWAVVIPCGSRDSSQPLKLELAVYPSSQDAKPRRIIALWNAKIEDSKLHKPDPAVIILDKSSSNTRTRMPRGKGCRRRKGRNHTVGIQRETRYKFASANEGDKQQLLWFYSACKGIPQVMNPRLPPNAVIPASAPPPLTEDVELRMAINASIQSAMLERPPLYPNTHLISESSNSNFWGNDKVIPVSHAFSAIPSSLPSAPPIPIEATDKATIHPPTIVGKSTTETTEVRENEGTSSSSCVICLDAQVEGACVPCGHMAGCMSCLNEIKAKKWGCPVCRANILQVIRLYTV